MSESTPETGTKFCKVCGNAYKRIDARFCSRCGAPAGGVKQGEEPNQNPTPSYKDPAHVSPVRKEQNASFPYSSATDTPIRDVSDSFGQNQIEKSFSKDDYKPILLSTVILLMAHLLKIMLLYNRFANLLEILVAIPLYLIVVLVVYTLNIYYYNSKGVYINHTYSKYNLAQALVSSTFFISIIPISISPDYKKSQLPEKFSIPMKQGNFTAYVEIPKIAYVNEYMRQRFLFLFEVIMAVLSLILLYNFVKIEDELWYVTIRLLTTFISGIVVADAAPIFGRHNKMLSSLYRLRTFLVFIVGLFVFVISIFDNFLFAIFGEYF